MLILINQTLLNPKSITCDIFFADATINPPFATKSRVAYAFASDVCRYVQCI